MNNDWINNVEELSNDRIKLYAMGIQKILDRNQISNAEAVVRLGERLGVLLIEAEKRGLSL